MWNQDERNREELKLPTTRRHNWNVHSGRDQVDGKFPFVLRCLEEEGPKYNKEGRELPSPFTSTTPKVPVVIVDDPRVSDLRDVAGGSLVPLKPIRRDPWSPDRWRLGAKRRGFFPSDTLNKDTPPNTTLPLLSTILLFPSVSWKQRLGSH